MSWIGYRWSPRTAAGVVLGVGSLLLVIGCGKGDVAGPPEIRFGQDTCSACGMIIEDERYAAAVVSATGDGDAPRLFDDVGEMLDFVPPGNAAAARRYVRDASTRQWVEASKATFVKSPDLPTPMGSGIAAYASPAAARAAADANGGTVLPTPPSPGSPTTR